jgi:hypothetical protein
MLISVLIISCEETVKEKKEIAFHGYVIDENGNPVSYADVVVIPEISYVETGKIKVKHSEEIILEVELASFNLVERQDHIEIMWETATEFNSKNFIIEKATEYQGEYEVLDSVQAKGNSISNQKYSYKDFDIESDHFYQYRLKINNTDGSFSYSNPRIIETLPDGVIISDNYPNPFYEYTNINFVIKDHNFFFEIIEGSTDQTIIESDIQNGFGHYSYTISSIRDDRVRRPGVYDFNLHYGDSIKIGEMYLDFIFDQSNCEIPDEVTKTDENGYFKITYNYFPDEYISSNTNEVGVKIGDILTTGYSEIIIRKKIAENENSITYMLSRQKVLIDKTKPGDVNFNATEFIVFK